LIRNNIQGKKNKPVKRKNLQKECLGGGRGRGGDKSWAHNQVAQKCFHERLIRLRNAKKGEFGSRKKREKVNTLGRGRGEGEWTFFNITALL